MQNDSWTGARLGGFALRAVTVVNGESEVAVPTSSGGCFFGFPKP